MQATFIGKHYSAVLRSLVLNGPCLEGSLKTVDDAALTGFLMGVGDRVREARAKRGMTRRILARDSGVSERYLAQLETGSGNPSITVLRQVADAMDVPIAELITGEPATPAALSPLLRQLQGLSADRRALAKRYIAELADEGQGASARKAGRIALIGLRGAGKSTLGRMIAERMGCPFLELNRIIEQEYGGSIGEILALNGQPAFRRYERRCLEQVLREHDRLVLATAGGIVSEPATFTYLLENTHTVWLRARPDEHMARVIAQGDLRPMARNDEAMEDLKAILAAREPDYRRADMSVDTSGLNVEEAAKALEEALGSIAAARPKAEIPA